MKNIKQIKLVSLYLSKERERFDNELLKIQTLIQKKELAIEKVISYKNEYNKNGYLALSRTIPSLSRNIDFFLAHISSIIAKESNELHKLNLIKNTIVDKCKAIRTKIDYIEECENKYLKFSSELEECKFQKKLDDLISTKQGRSYND